MKIIKAEPPNSIRSRMEWMRMCRTLPLEEENLVGYFQRRARVRVESQEFVASIFDEVAKKNEEYLDLLRKLTDQIDYEYNLLHI
jgi:hypothetical protein